MILDGKACKKQVRRNITTHYISNTRAHSTPTLSHCLSHQCYTHCWLTLSHWHYRSTITANASLQHFSLPHYCTATHQPLSSYTNTLTVWHQLPLNAEYIARVNPVLTTTNPFAPSLLHGSSEGRFFPLATPPWNHPHHDPVSLVPEIRYDSIEGYSTCVHT